MAVVILIVLYFSAPPPEQNWRPEPYDSFLLASWLGGVALHWAFWPFFLLLNASLLFADQLAMAGKITVSSWDEIHFVLLFPIAWWTVSVWRCSRNTHSRTWSALARFATIAVPVEYAIKLLIRIDYPRIFFNCEDLLLDYGSCF
ncbi:MAG: hypothetical protein ABL933_18980 [Methyloglobulus sp.]